MNKLDQFELLMAMDANHMPTEYGNDIFHYTSSGGFQSILFSDSDKLTLWASRYTCLNDSSEGTIAEEILKEVCIELRDSGEISPYLFDLFSNVKTARTILLHRHEGDTVKITRPECHRYVCSFSKNSDSLAMWNYYSKGNMYEGFNIGLYSFVLKENLEVLFRNLEAVPHIYPVIYEKSQQKQLIQKLLLRLTELYEKDKETEIRYIISNRLLDWALVFKKDYFQHEEEVRIIIDVAKREQNIPIKYRTYSGYVIPYIELKLDKYNVSCVNFGPLQANESQIKQQLQVMEEMLMQNNYSALVDYSKIPIRY